MVLLSVAIVGCPLSVTPERDPIRPEIACTPTVAGIVAAVDHEVGSGMYTLEDGTAVRVSQGPTRLFGPEPTVGDLLLYGESEACGPFRARAVPRDRPDFPGCLGISSEFGLDDGEFVLLESGLRLPKGEDFVTRGRYVSMSPLFCLNEQGEVVFFNHL